MKKISIYALGLLAGAALVACDDYKEPNPPSQMNPKPVVLKATDVKVTDEASSTTYDLNSLKEEKQDILLATITCDVLPAGYTFNVNTYISVDDLRTPMKCLLR